MKRIYSWMGWAVLWLIGPAAFLAALRNAGLEGFPLDDAWIHQTYARSLAAGLGWTYAGGQPSAGSTSPLWTMLQVPSFWLGISPVVWSCSLGILLLLLNAVLVREWVRTADERASRYAGLFCLWEWHLLWAALSGMEILLFCGWAALVLLLFFPLDSAAPAQSRSLRRTVLTGLALGAGIWIRPEAILLSGVALCSTALRRGSSARRNTVVTFLGACAPVLAYMAFELHLGGRFLPNTFFVKTTEYSGLASQNLLLRIIRPLEPLLAGPLVVLALFIPFAVGQLIRKRNIPGVLPLVWAIGHVLLYAFQLPVTYQHGRYFLPVLPVLIGYGAYGYFALRAKWVGAAPTRIVSRALWGSAVGLTALFVGIGSGQFVEDVRVIDSEMVTVSLWIRDNMPADTVVAAHDIGALGFWSGRRIVDLGGVTDLRALDVLSGTTPLREYLLRTDADLLMTMPDFYPAETGSCVPLGAFPVGPSSLPAGSRTMLYDWRTGCGW